MGNRLILTAVLAFGVISGYAQGPTMAFFTDTATSATNTFSTGTIDITHNSGATLLTLTSTKPGDKVTQPLTITNGGTLSLNYTVASAVTNTDSKNLGEQLKLVIKTSVTCTTGGFDTGGTELYGTVASPSPLSSLAGGLTLINGRTLSSGSETVCFQVSVPTSGTVAAQGATTTATFTVSAQTN